MTLSINTGTPVNPWNDTSNTKRGSRGLKGMTVSLQPMFPLGLIIGVKWNNKQVL